MGQKERVVQMKADKAYLSCKNLLLFSRERTLLKLYFTFFHLDATATEERSQRHRLMEKAVLQGIRDAKVTNNGMPETADDWWEARSLYYLCWKAESLLH